MKDCSVFSLADVLYLFECWLVGRHCPLGGGLAQVEVLQEEAVGVEL